MLCKCDLFCKKKTITRIIFFFAYLSDDTSINGCDSFDILTFFTEKEVYRKMGVTTIIECKCASLESLTKLSKTSLKNKAKVVARYVPHKLLVNNKDIAIFLPYLNYFFVDFHKTSNK